MILQYESNNKEIYKEGNTIGLSQILAVGKPFGDINGIIDFAVEQIKCDREKDVFAICDNEIFNEEYLKTAQFVKAAIFNDGAKNTIYLFKHDSNIYLLNDNGKTIRRF